MPPRGAAAKKGYAQLRRHATQLVGWCLVIRLTPYVLDYLQQQRLEYCATPLPIISICACQMLLSVRPEPSCVYAEA